MFRSLLAFITVLSAGTAEAKDRTYTIRGDGYLDPTGPGVRLEMDEARVTLRDNREFLATFMARGERVVIRGRWDPRGRDAIEQVSINDAFGARAEGTGTLQFDGNHDRVIRIMLQGRTREGAFRVDIRERGGRPDDWNDRDRDDRYDRDRPDLGEGNRVFRNVDATTDGKGILRLAGVRNGDFTVARVRLGTSRDVTIDIDRGTRGSIRGEITDIRDHRVAIRVTNVLGHRASGEIIAHMQSAHEVDRLNGSGGSDGGSWQFDFTGTERPERGDGRDWSDNDRDWPSRFPLEANSTGSGTLSQDVGPALSFDRARVTLQNDRNAIVVLEGRRQTIRLAGRWSESYGDRITIDLTQVNEKRANGRLNVRTGGRSLLSLDGGGATDMGRFRVSFDRR
jgi:hypothetical protein